QRVQVVEQRLRAADREGWHQDVAVTLDGAPHDALELPFDVVVTAAVFAVAVGALHHHEIYRALAPALAVVPQDGRVGATEIAAHDHARPVTLEVHTRGTEDVPRLPKRRGARKAGHLNGSVVGHRAGELLKPPSKGPDVALGGAVQ